MEYDIEFTQRDEVPTVVVRAEVAVPQISAFLGDAFGEVMGAISSAGRFPAGPPFARYDMTQVSADAPPGSFLVEAGFPVNEPVDKGALVGRVIPAALPGGPVALTVHTGSYEGVAAAYAAIERALADAGKVPTGAPWECYLDDPTEVREPHTEVVWPCADAAAG